MVVTYDPVRDTRPAEPHEIDGRMFDPFTAMHGATGFVCGRIGIGFWPTMAIAAGWEIVERILKEKAPDAPWHRGLDGTLTQDSVANMVGDVVATAVGWFVGSR